MSLNAKGICKLCQGTDFLAFFTSKPPKTTKLCTLKHAQSCLSCAICRIFHGLNTPELEGRSSSNITIEVQRRTLEGQEYLRTTNIAPVYSLCFVAKTGKNESLFVLSFDLCGGHDDHGLAHPAKNTDWWMVSTPIGPYFDTALVNRWLESNEEKEDKEDSQSAKVESDIARNDAEHHDRESDSGSALASDGEWPVPRHRR
jgi:hypothetical protein